MALGSRQHFTRAIELVPTPQAKAQARRALAMSYAFDGDCARTVHAAQPGFDYYGEAQAFAQQGGVANEAARVCIDAGDLDTAAKWYGLGYAAGLQEPDSKPGRVSLWTFRWEHAQARIAARRGKPAEAEKHVAAARAILDNDAEMAKAQAVLFPYLKGYVAFYSGDPNSALEWLLKANQNDAFIQCLTGQTYETLGDREKALEYCRKASTASAHNPPAAYARPLARKKLSVQ
jgi:tetratricopeptide (TPR) repeat protein